MLKAVSSHLGLSVPTSLRSVATAAASSFYDITEFAASGETLSFAKFKGKVVSSWASSYCSRMTLRLAEPERTRRFMASTSLPNEASRLRSTR